MGDIYDGVFRTIVNDCRQFLIPFVNEVFHEKYTGEEEIQFLRVSILCYCALAMSFT